MVSISYRVMHCTEFLLRKHSPNFLKLVLNYKVNLVTTAAYMKNTTIV